MIPEREQGYIWPTYEDITGVLTTLALHLFGIAGETHLAFAVQDKYIETLYVAIEGALQHVREYHGDEWDEVLGALEEELTPSQFVQRWREAISAMASGPLAEAPAVVRGLRSLIDIGERSGEALVVVSLEEIEDQ